MCPLERGRGGGERTFDESKTIKVTEGRLFVLEAASRVTTNKKRDFDPFERVFAQRGTHTREHRFHWRAFHEFVERRFVCDSGEEIGRFHGGSLIRENCPHDQIHLAWSLFLPCGCNGCNACAPNTKRYHRFFYSIHINV